MIGGRVLDSPALIEFGQGLPFAQTTVWAAVASDVVLAVPAAALAVAWASLDDASHREVLKVLLDLPETVIEPVDGQSALLIGDTLRGHMIGVAAAQVIRSARSRDWTVVTSSAAGRRIRDAAPDVRLDELP